MDQPVTPPRRARGRRRTSRTAWGTGSPLLRTGRRTLRTTALVSALTLVGSLVAMVAPLTVANADHVEAYGGYHIDGKVPDDEDFDFYGDPFGSVSELGPVNGSTTKVNVIHEAAPPMLGLTKPNGNTDLRGVWLDSNADSAGDVWLYFAWERDSNTGSSVIHYEFQRNGVPAACAYATKTEQQLIDTCNPWASRAAGDFVLVFDQQGNTIVVSKRTFVGVGRTLVLGDPIAISSTDVKALPSSDGFAGEAAINLSESVFKGLSATSCVSVANVVAGTVVGNSDQAEFMDAVLADTRGTYISSCGSVKVTKRTDPGGLTGPFAFGIARTSGLPSVYPAGDPKTQSISGDGLSTTFTDLRQADDYRLTESVPTGWTLQSIVCDGVDVTDGTPGFAVRGSEVTECIVTNKKALPKLTIEKTASPKTYSALGDTISYSYVVTNEGNVDLAGPVTVADDKILAPAKVTCSAPDGLVVGASTTCSATYAITQADLDAGSVINTAVAKAKHGNDVVESEPDSETVTAGSGVVAAVTLDKASTATRYRAAGDVVPYTYEVVNTGKVTLKGLKVDDDVVTAAGSTVSCPTTTLAPGAKTTCTAATTITQAHVVAGTLTNTAKATTDRATSNTDTWTVTADRPGISLLKSTTPGATYDAVGQTLSYTYVVTNSGNTTLTGRVAVADDKTGSTDCPALPVTLAPLETVTCTDTYAVTQDDLDLGRVRNVAVATLAGQTSNRSEVTVVGKALQPALTVTKTALPVTYSVAGQVVDYTYVVRNSGPLTLDGPFTVEDDKTGTSCPDTGKLAPGATLTCTAQYRITQDDLDDGSVTNKAVAQGALRGEPVRSGPAFATVRVEPSTGLVLDKTVAETSYDAAGQSLRYTYVVTNSGNQTLIGPLTVTDDKTPVTCPAGDQRLAPKASLTCTAIYAVSQSDVDAGSVTNLAVARLGGVRSNTDSAVVPAFKSPVLGIVKSARQATYAASGDVVDYSYVVTNLGNTTMASVAVLDDKTSTTCPAGPVAPRASVLCSARYTVTQADVDAGSVTNVAFARGGGVDSPTDTVTVRAAQTPRLTIVKTPTPTTYSAVGQEVAYSYVVRNAGNTTLAGPFTVADDKIARVSCPVGSLSPGAAMTCTATHTVTQADLDAGSITNLATATNGSVASNQTSATVDAVRTPGLSLTKAAAPVTYSSIGQAITYTYVVTNSGNTTLAGPFRVSDDKTPVACPADASLPPGASLTCTATYAITSADVVAGSVTNVASATNGTVTSPQVRATVTADVEVLPAPALVPPVTAQAEPEPAATAPAPTTPRQLPFTGANLLPVLVAGSSALLLGLLVLLATRRRYEPGHA